jgi:hypothetical protein
VTKSIDLATAGSELVSMYLTIYMGWNNKIAGAAALPHPAHMRFFLLSLDCYLLILFSLFVGRLFCILFDYVLAKPNNT